MPRHSRYRASEIKAGIWIFIAVVLFTVFMVSITGSRFWKKMDYYYVRLKYVGGLEVGSPVRMGGMLVGKISNVQFADDPEGGIELTLEIQKGLRIKDNTLAYLSFISITSEQHLELEQKIEPAPFFSPGDRIPSKELTTMDEVMEHIGFVGDTLLVILSRANKLLKPVNIARIDSIVAGINNFIQESSPDLIATLASGRRAIEQLDTLINNVDQMIAGNDSLLRHVLIETREAIDQLVSTLAGIDSTVEDVDRLVLNNAGNLMQILDNVNQASRNLSELTSQVKENPFLLIRAFPKKERRISK
ncbi:MAG TPA: MlaD family protein [archaeon]|nr:MlaD family protein [archaeon]